MKNLLRYLIPLFLLFTTHAGFAQQVEMADTMRSEGKIYVVVAIILVVLVGLITYLFILDRKLTKMERYLAENQQTKL